MGMNISIAFINKTFLLRALYSSIEKKYLVSFTQYSNTLNILFQNTLLCGYLNLKLNVTEYCRKSIFCCFMYTVLPLRILAQSIF